MRVILVPRLGSRAICCSYVGELAGVQGARRVGKDLWTSCFLVLMAGCRRCLSVLFAGKMCVCVCVWNRITLGIYTVAPLLGSRTVCSGGIERCANSRFSRIEQSAGTLALPTEVSSLSSLRVLVYLVC